MSLFERRDFLKHFEPHELHDQMHPQKVIGTLWLWTSHENNTYISFRRRRRRFPFFGQNQKNRRSSSSTVDLGLTVPSLQAKSKQSMVVVDNCRSWFEIECSRFPFYRPNQKNWWSSSTLVGLGLLLNMIGLSRLSRSLVSRTDTACATQRRKK